MMGWGIFLPFYGFSGKTQVDPSAFTPIHHLCVSTLLIHIPFPSQQVRALANAQHLLFKPRTHYIFMSYFPLIEEVAMRPVWIVLALLLSSFTMQACATDSARDSGDATGSLSDTLQPAEQIDPTKEDTGQVSCVGIAPPANIQQIQHDQCDQYASRAAGNSTTRTET